MTLIRKTLFKTFIGAAMAFSLSANAQAADMDATSQATFDTVMTFMGAIGSSGNMDTATALMAGDMEHYTEHLPGCRSVLCRK